MRPTRAVHHAWVGGAANAISTRSCGRALCTRTFSSPSASRLPKTRPSCHPMPTLSRAKRRRCWPPSVASSALPSWLLSRQASRRASPSNWQKCARHLGDARRFAGAAAHHSRDRKGLRQWLATCRTRAGSAAAVVLYDLYRIAYVQRLLLVEMSREAANDATSAEARVRLGGLPDQSIVWAIENLAANFP